MSDTSKATPRPWEIRVADPAIDEIEDMSLYLIETPLVGKTIGGIIDEQEANAVLLKESANSYNPERDQLARKLAEMIAAPCRSYCGSACAHKKARQLLRLFDYRR